MKKRRDAVLAASLAIIIYAGLYVFGIGCPIKFATGLSCPGCGMTRAWISVLHFQFHRAFDYHPLFLLGPVLILTIFLYEKKKSRIYLLLLILQTVVFFVVYLFRLFDESNTIVTFDLGNNLIFRIIIKEIYKII